MFLISKQFPLAVKFIRRFSRHVGRTLTDVTNKCVGFPEKLIVFIRVSVKIDERDIVKLSLLRFQCSYRLPRKPVITTESEHEI